MTQENEYAPQEKAQKLINDANALFSEARNAEKSAISGLLDHAERKAKEASDVLQGEDYPEMKEIIAQF